MRPTQRKEVFEICLFSSSIFTKRRKKPVVRSRGIRSKDSHPDVQRLISEYGEDSAEDDIDIPFVLASSRNHEISILVV
jgi:hypothetical protein